VADTKAPEPRVQIRQWRPVEYGGYTRGHWEVDFDGDDLEASVNVSGYNGYGDRVYMPLDLLRALLSAHGLAVVNEADRKVLDACAAMVLCDDDPDLAESEPMEPQEHGEDCYIYTDDQYAIAKAELARRAVPSPRAKPRL